MSDKIEIIIAARDKFSGAFGKLTGMLPSAKTLALGTAAAIGGIGTALIAMTKSTANAYDKVQKFSERIGISTEALSSYHHAAELSGVSTMAFDTSLQRMTRRISEAEQGIGVAVNALDELDISIDSITGKSPDQQFEIIAGAMEGMASQSDKVRLAMQFFDTEGVGMLQMLTNGTKGLKEMTTEAERFGLVISAEAGANAASFNDSLTRITASFTGLRNKIAEDVMPVMTEMANKFANFVADNREKIIDFGKKAGGSFLEIVEKGVFAAAVLHDAWRGLGMIFATMQIGFYSFIQGLETTGKKIGDWLISTGWAERQYDETKRFFKIMDATGKSTAETEANLIKAEEALNKLVETGSSLGRVEEIIDLMKEKFKELTTEMSEDNFRLFSDISSYLELNAANAQTNADEIVEIHTMRLEQIRELEAAKQAEDAVILAQWQSDEEVRAQEEIARTKAIADTKMAIERQFYSNLLVIGRAFGRTMFKIMQLAAVPRMWIDAHEAATKSLAAYPFPWNIVMAAASYGAVAAHIATVSGLAPAAHGGITSVPREQTFLLDKGERVLSPNQNQDFTDFIGGGNAGSQSINVEVLPNASNVQAMLQMDKDDWYNIVNDKVIPAMKRLKTVGVEV